MNRALAAALAALLLAQAACLGPQRVPDPLAASPAFPSIPCRTYRPAQASPSVRDVVESAALAGAGVVAVLGALAAGGAVRCGSSCTSSGPGAVLLLGALVAGAIAAVGQAPPPPPRGDPARAARCDAQLARHCQGLEDDLACRRALEAACAAEDDDACWALAPPPPTEPPPPPPPPCRSDLYPSLPCGAAR